MKNKLHNRTILITLFFVLTQIGNLFANDILIDAKIIDVQDKGNSIAASGSVNIRDGDRILIKGDKAKYNKVNQKVEIVGNVSFFDKEKNYEVRSNKITFDRINKKIFTYKNTEANIFDVNGILNFKIKGEDSFFDQNNNILEINKNVRLIDKLSKYEILSEKIIYSQIKEEIKSLYDTQINYNNEFIIKSKDILFDKRNNILSTDKKTIITDNSNNKFEFSSLNFDLNKNIFKGKKIKLFDDLNNSIELENGIVNLKNNELIGSNFIIKLNKNTFGNAENDPRLIGRYIIKDKEETKMKKSSFTTCKNVDGKCPAWLISADEVIHKREKKRIEYKNAWLKIYDMPVAYFPYFFHPDPDVKRQSGFLLPQFINSSNLGFSTQIPYYLAIDDEKDLTLSPRVYTNNNLFIQTEYRQEFKNSSFVSDLSFNNNDNSNSHFFSTLKGEIENSFYEMKIQSVSNDNYLKRYQVSSPLIKNYSVLESSFLIEEYGEDYSFSTSLEIIEDLSKNNSDRFEYLFPNYSYDKEIFLKNNVFDTFNFKSSGNYRKFNTNVDEANVVNDFLFTSSGISMFDNFESELNFLLRNFNTYGNLSDKYKDDTNHKNLGALVYNLKYPLFKKNENHSKFLTPILSLRYSPNKGTNFKNDNILIKYENIFNLDRINNQTIESDGSATAGLEYKKIDNNQNDKIKIGFAMNFRNNEDEDIPLSTSLGQKTSDLIGYSGINISENLSINYDFSINQNLSETNYSLIAANYNGTKFKTSFEYLEKSNFIGDESYLINFSELEIDKSNSLAFETNKNLDKNLTNYYNMIYKYKNDCLEASIVYNKQFYNDNDVNSGQNIFFKISLVPFATIKSADPIN